LPHEDDMDNSIHSHTAQPFLMPPDGKFLSSGSFNFSMAALAADSAALAGNHWGKLQNIEYI
jgi:histidine ammonia-lyase